MEGESKRVPFNVLVSCTMMIAFFLLTDACLISGAAPLSKVQDCHDDAQCPLGQYCMKDFDRHVCDECIDCSLINRMHKVPCSKKKIDCGECRPGYVNTQGRCLPENKPVLVEVERPLISLGSVSKHGNNINETHLSKTSSPVVWPWITVGVVLASVVTSIVTAVVVCRLKNRVTQNTHEDGPEKEKILETSGSGEDGNGSLPSAPPPYSFPGDDGQVRFGNQFPERLRDMELTLLNVEYSPPPSSNPNFNETETGTASKRLLTEDSPVQKALPFSRGLAYGPETEEYLGPQVPDQDDGAGAAENPNDVLEALLEEALYPVQPAQEPDAVVPAPSPDNELLERSYHDMSQLLNPNDLIEPMDEAEAEVPGVQAHVDDVMEHDGVAEAGAMEQHVDQWATPPPAPPGSVSRPENQYALRFHLNLQVQASWAQGLLHGVQNNWREGEVMMVAAPPVQQSGFPETDQEVPDLADNNNVVITATAVDVRGNNEGVQFQARMLEGAAQLLEENQPEAPRNSSNNNNNNNSTQPMA